MRADPEQRAVQLAEYIVEQGATVRAAAAAFGCSKSTVHKCTRTFRCGWSGSARGCRHRCGQCWHATKPSGICAAGLPPAENTVNRSAAPLHAAGWTEQGRCCVQCPARNWFKAPFSSRDTCA